MADNETHTNPPSQQAEQRRLTLTGIAHRCAQETEHFFQRRSYDPQYCFELFRRAILERNQRAWELVYAQYRPLVAGWVGRHSAFSVSGEEVQYFVNRAFEKMWAALTPGKFGHFPNLKSVLRYLQMCVHSAVLDHVRVTDQPVVGVPVEGLADESGPSGSSAENQVLARVHRQEFWDEIKARLRNEKEHHVVYGSFVLALKPRELFAHFQETFRDVNEVYRVKENVLARLRRDAELEKLLAPDAVKKEGRLV
jgi:DNA-directed RNA polymerase specialized sigma24 family protein